MTKRKTKLKKPSPALPQRLKIQSRVLSRRVARFKPYLTQANQERRLAWALNHQDWSIQDWMKVIWTDESAFYIGRFRGRV